MTQPSPIVIIDYTNWKGERRERRITPLSVQFENSEWHPETQWILEAVDEERGVIRDFAMVNIHSWRPAHMTQPKQQPYPRFLPDRYEIRNGKFGPYFHDKRGAVDMPLLEVLATLNRYALRKDQLRWYVETYGEQPA